MITKKLPKANKNDSGTVKTVQYLKLAMLNKWLALVFVVQAAAVVLFGNGLTVSVTTQYLAVDGLATEASGSQVLATATRHLYDLPVGWVLAAALVVFAVGHLLSATVFRRRYEQDLSLGLNRWRWFSFGLGGGLVLIVLCLLGGISELGVILPVLALAALGGALVLVTEKLVIEHKGVKTHMAHFLCAMAAVSAFLPWLVLALGVKGALLYDGQLPGYLYGAYGSAAVMSLVVAGATHLRLVRRGRLANSLYAECVYMVLGLVGMSLVVWQIFVGALVS